MPNANQDFETAMDAAIAGEDADKLELALNLVPKLNAGLSGRFEELLIETWHHSHEEIIRYLQNNPSDSSIEAIRLAILLKPQLKYLHYDDYGAYYKKCFWALAVNPNPNAIDVIRDFLDSDNEALRKQAIYRLGKIGPENA